MVSLTRTPLNSMPNPDGEVRERDHDIGIASSSLLVARRLFERRVILLFDEITVARAQEVATSLLAMDHSGTDPISIILNSQGGHVEAGDTVHDLIRFVRAPVKILGTGWVASAGAHIFLAAHPERRFCLPNTRFMIHQPLGGVGGKAVDVAIEAREIIRVRGRLNRIIARETGQPLDKVNHDTDRNFWMTAEEARDYGIVTHIIERAADFA